MARIPSWSELSMVVDELSRTQKECYNSVHQLLDSGIPELDRKIGYLMSKPNEIPLTSSSMAAPHAPATHPTYTRPKDPAITTVSITEKPMDIDPETIPMPTAITVAPEAKKSHTVTTIKTSASVPSFPPPAPKPAIKTVVTAKTKNHRTNGTKPSQSNGVNNGHKTSIEDLKHLRAPKLPLSEYLRKNRPDILMNVEARSSYIKKISDERKSQRHYRIISSLERIRISSKGHKKVNTNQQRQTAQRLPTRAMRNYDAPDYCVKHKLGEREMKQLTLRNYRRLPEVKKQKLEEVNKHLKEQYYKNRQLYGRMLLNNFKNGIINYPLRASYDDRSITSSQSEYSMSQSADGTACSSMEHYY